jgi:GIY-YIG catalytic domain
MDRPDDDYDYNIKTFTNPSTWTPADHKLCQPTLDTVQRIVRATESSMRNHRIIKNRFVAINNCRDNLTHDERQAIIELRDNRDIVIKPADKGSATVIMDKWAYVAEAHRQLNNAKYYRKLDHPIYRDNVSGINETLEDLTREHYITDRQLAYLQAKTTDRARIFYLLPKIHKAPSKWPQPNMPEGRPIVSDCGSESYRVSDYINYFLRPISTRHRSYIKDTYDFVSKVRHKNIPKGAFLVTGDVTALYTNMDIERTLAVTRRALIAHPQPDRPDEHILTLLELTLRNNDFTFNGQFYLQIYGTAMGKTYAPALADLYMEEFDDRAMDEYDIKPLLYSRFLDDIFFVWTGTLQQLLDYEKYLNSLIPGIKVTLNYSQETVNFLDTTVYKQHESAYDTLLTRVYFKATDTHQLLHKTSFHPRHTTRGVLKSQLIRFKRLSSSFDDYDTACKTLFRALTKRHYSKRMMRAMKKEIWAIPNVNPQRNASNNTNGRILPIVLPFNEIGTQLASRWKSIINDNGLFLDLRLISAYTCGRNLRRSLVRSSLEVATTRPADDDDDDGPPGCTRCTSNRCRACNYVTTGKRFHGTSNDQYFVIRRNITCKTHNVIYLVTCNRCKLQYVGQTSRTLADRINDHLSCIRTGKNTPIGLHFNIPGHTLQDFSIMGIERMYNKSDTRETILIKERTWQNLLQTAHPKGINNLKASLLH